MNGPVRLAILGATGSIGSSTLDVVARHPERFSVDVLAARRNVEALATLCSRFRPRVAIIADASRQDALHAQLKALNVQCEVHAGGDAVTAAGGATSNDTVIAAIVGAAGLESTLAAARAGKRLLLANKESVVMAGPLLMQALHEGGGELIPIDSEHNAIFQCLPGGRPPLDKAGVRRIVLTASGGPFRGRSRESLRTVTPDQACAHPNWDMGRKISVDSASMMNKGLEVIEAHHLFGATPESIDVLVHPQSMVHSMVEYLDGSMLAQLGHPDMRTALAHALAWPDRIEAGVPSLDLAQVASLHFEAPDTDTFRCLPLAFEALREGGDAPAILNAANEVAVAAFLDGALPFLRIPQVIETVLTELPAQAVVDIATLVHRDGIARQSAQRAIARHC